MRPPGTPVASVIIQSLDLVLQRQCDKPYLYLLVAGTGIFAPAVQIPNAWWDRPRLIEHLDVGRPHDNGHGLLTLNFHGRCSHVEELQALMDAGVREAIEREIVPAVLVGLGMAKWNVADAPPLEPVSRPFGTPTDWEEPAPPRPAAAVIQDLIRMAAGQAPSIAREVVLREAVAQNMIDPGKIPRLVHSGWLDELVVVGAEDKSPPPKQRPPRRRIVDT